MPPVTYEGRMVKPAATAADLVINSLRVTDPEDSLTFLFMMRVLNSGFKIAKIFPEDIEEEPKEG